MMKETQYILDSISTLIDISKVEVSKENVDYKGRKYISDYVILNKSDNIGFEVFEGEEIRVFYLREHSHFGIDYGMKETEIVDAAVDLLRKVLTCKVKYAQVFKGDKLKKETIYFLVNNQWEKGCTTSYSFVTKINPFAKKTIKETIWEFKKSGEHRE